MSNKIKLILSHILIIFSIVYLLVNMASIVIETIFSIQNDSFMIFLRVGALFHVLRIVMPILIIIFTLFVLKKIKAKNIANNKFLNILFYMIYSISIFLLGLMFFYILNNPDYIIEIQTIPFGKIHLFLIAGYTLLTVPLIGMTIALSILLLNYRISKNNGMKNY